MDADLEARKQEARQILALHSALPGTEVPLWKTLELSYFARHDASEIAWHARALWRHLDPPQPVVCARPSPIGDGLQVLVHAPDRPDLFVRICGYFDGAGFSIATSAGTRSGGLPATSSRTKPARGVPPAGMSRGMASPIASRR
jgi:[protein-PII] uridylyltransferase